MTRRAVLGAAGLALLAACVVWFLPYACARSGGVPTFTDVRAQRAPSDAIVLDRHGEMLGEVRVDDQRRRLQWTALGEVSPALRSAVIASEDRRFATHRGVDALALVGVGARALLGERMRGASTITMQVAAMLDDSLQSNRGPRTTMHKWRQMRWAWALERVWGKEQILEAYLNLVSFRGELQGVSAATRGLLRKAPDGVTDGEALVLAALVRAPNAGSDAVIRRARKLRDATAVAVAYDELVATAAKLLRAKGPINRAFAPHLARRLLNDFVRAGGAKPETRTIRATIDAGTQQVAAQALRQQLLALADKRVRDGAVLVVDNVSGEVLAYVGGSDDLSSGRHVDAVVARRQAGSTLKPFLYALAFDNRLLTPASLLLDSPLDVPVFGGVYRPENYDQSFSGVVPARTALAASLNIPAVRVLDLVGADAFVGQLRRLGFGALREPGDFYGPALALGAADVSLEELVNAYRALANRGQFGTLRFHLDADPNGGQCFRTAGHCAATPSNDAYTAGTTFLVSNILADRESRSATFGLESPLATRFWTAVKTGTSKSMRDNWCVGYSERFTVGVWVGNLSGEPMRGVSGMSGAAPVWVAVMEWLHRNASSRAPAPPADVVAAHSVAGGAVRGTEWYLSGTEPVQSVVQATRGRHRITAPAAGAVIAVDPDIPAAYQRVTFDADIETGSGRWQLDGVDIGAVSRTMLWAPRPGSHQLTLLARDGQVLDRIAFTVRGGGIDRHAATRTATSPDDESNTLTSIAWRRGALDGVLAVDRQAAGGGVPSEMVTR